MITRLRIKSITLILLIGLTIVLAFRFWAVLKLWQTERNYLGMVVFVPKPEPARELKAGNGEQIFQEALERWKNNPKFRIEFHQFHLILILLIVSTISTAGYSYWLHRTRKHKTPDLVKYAHERSISDA